MILYSLMIGCEAAIVNQSLMTSLIIYKRVKVFSPNQRNLRTIRT